MAYSYKSNASVGAIPTVIDDCRLFEVIARGRSGEVHYAVQSSGGERGDALLAVKRLAPEIARDARLVERWVAAANRSAQLSHPGICRIARVDTCNGETYCVMALCSGLDLGRIRARLNERDEALPIDLAALIVSRVAAALEAAHSFRAPRVSGIFHGDLTLSDVMVGYDGSVKVLNVGLSTAIAPPPIPGDRDGSTAAGNARADVASLGHCLLELARSAERNDPGSSGPGRIDGASEGGDVGALRSIAARAIEVRPGARFTSAAAVRKALDQFLAARGVPITEQSLSDWMTATFEAERRASLELEARIKRHAAQAVAERSSRIESRPLRTERDDMGNDAIDAVLEPRRSDSAPRSLVVTRPPPPMPRAAKLPPPEPPSRVLRSDPDVTPARGVLIERLAAEMKSGEHELPSRRPLHSSQEEATRVWVPQQRRPTPEASMAAPVPVPAAPPARQAVARPEGSRPMAASPPQPASVPPPDSLAPRARSMKPLWIGGAVCVVAAGLLASRPYVFGSGLSVPGTASASQSAPASGSGARVVPAGAEVNEATAAAELVRPEAAGPGEVGDTTAAPSADLRANEYDFTGGSRDVDRALRSRRDSGSIAVRRRPASRAVASHGERSEADHAEPTDAIPEPADTQPPAPAASATVAANGATAHVSPATPVQAADRASAPVAVAPSVAPAPPPAARVAAPQVREAVPISQERPLFPARARRNNVHSGSVVLGFTIDRAGNVRNPVVIQSTPADVFDEAAINAVSKWRYQPRLENGVAVESPNVRVRVRFTGEAE